MKIITRKVDNQPLTIIVEYPRMDLESERIIEKIKHMDVHFIGKMEDKSTRIDISDVYYFENVERKIFLYTRKDVFRFDGNMADLDEMAINTELVRVSRTCIINTEHLKEIRQIKNSHLEAIMDNDEIIIVSRKYLKDIKNVFRRSSV